MVVVERHKIKSEDDFCSTFTFHHFTVKSSIIVAFIVALEHFLGTPYLVASTNV